MVFYSELESTFGPIDIGRHKKWPKLALAVIFSENFTSKTPFKFWFSTYLAFWNFEKAWDLQDLC